MSSPSVAAGVGSSTSASSLPPLAAKGGGGASSSGGRSHERTGRIVRLHFSCHAELPLGSFLRVTGSTLWAPGTSADDPCEATQTYDKTEAMAFPVAEDPDLENPPVAELYASSVEMVTTPEEYPVWRTRKPVVLVIHNNRKAVQHHYYRYMVVCPGATLEVSTTAAEAAIMDENEAHVSTSNELVGQTPVMDWEDPFGSLGDRSRRGEASSLSVTSSVTMGQVTRSDFRNLPYRTVDIDVKTGMPVLSGDDSAAVAAASTPRVVVDRWNMPDDDTFRPYRIREAVRLCVFLVEAFPVLIVVFVDLRIFSHLFGA